MKGKPYECRNCGNSKARWHIYLTDSIGSKCERCYQEYMRIDTHISSFYLNDGTGGHRWDGGRMRIRS